MSCDRVRHAIPLRKSARPAWRFVEKNALLMQGDKDKSMTNQSKLSSWLGAFMLTIGVAGLSGCSDLNGFEKLATVREATLQTMANLNMDRGAPVMLRIYKEEKVMEVWKQNHNGQYVLLKSFPICKYSGTIGPKVREGDHQAPEGFYDITPEEMNPLLHEYLSFNIGFPNVFDRSLGRTGSFIMVHGGCRSIGCYAMTDEQMDEIYGLVTEAFRGGQDKVQLQAFPFRMTEANLALHATSPDAQFWSMLKEGSDAFEKVGLPPIVTVCNQRYVFNVAAASDDTDPMSSCPATAVAPKPITDAPHLAGHLFARQIGRKQFAHRVRTQTQTIMRHEVGLRSSAKAAALHNAKERKIDRHNRFVGRA
jgi:murein L,D-transpeptidase YafK